MIQFFDKPTQFFKLNTSAIYVLPIFDILFDKLNFKNRSTYFTPLAIDHGLINTYLDPHHDTLELAFLNDKKHIKESRQDLINLIIASEYYKYVSYSDINVLVICMRIPDKYAEDLHAIRENRIDDLSFMYLMPFQDRYQELIIKPETTLADLYMKFNIPLCVIQKCEMLYEYFEYHLHTTLPRDKFLSAPYNKAQESLVLVNLQKFDIFL